MIASEVILFWCPGIMPSYKGMRDILSIPHEARGVAKNTELHEPLNSHATPLSSEGTDIPGKGSSGWYAR